MTADTQLAVDLAARAQGKAKQNAIEMMANHLRFDHGWSVRKVGRRLGITDKQVRVACGEQG
jgi:hypothetical protein